VSDRDCGAIEKAQQHGVATEVMRTRDKHDFCNRLLVYLQVHHIDYVISFYTKLFVGPLLEHYRDRIINLHPSLLPAFKGLDGFGDTLAYGTRYIGTTIHFIDDKMDEGKIVIQTAYPLDVNRPESALRHRIFEQQCKSLLQLIKWLVDRRVHVEGHRVCIDAATFEDFEYSPSLDFKEAIDLHVPLAVTA